MLATIDQIERHLSLLLRAVTLTQASMDSGETEAVRVDPLNRFLNGVECHEGCPIGAVEDEDLLAATLPAFR
jgi:hypothetical protein